jgi:hypothetical protein
LSLICFFMHIMTILKKRLDKTSPNYTLAKKQEL